MKLLKCLSIWALLLTIVCCLGLFTEASNESLNRQSRSIGSSSSSNMIDHGNGKSKIEMERKQVQEFLTTKNILKSIMKLIFGSQDEISATSRNVISILGKVSVSLPVKLPPLDSIQLKRQ